MKFRFAAFILFLFSRALCFGQQLDIRAQVNETRVSVGQQFIYSVNISVDQMNVQLPAVQAPDFGGLALVRELGSSQSSSIQIINGRQSASVILSTKFVLTAPSEGEFTIGPAKVVFNGKEYLSNTLQIRVTKAEALNLPSALQGGSILPAQTNNPNLTRQLAGRLFMVATVDNHQPFQGQPVRVTYTVYTDIEPERPVVDSWLTPEMEGLPNKEFDYAQICNLVPVRGQVPQQPPAQLKEMEGRTFRAITVLDLFAIPLQSGQLKLGPYHVLARVPVENRNDPFGFPSFFDDNTQVAVLPTVALTLDVKPLPAEGRPPQAKQVLIGEFTAKAELDRQRMTQDELATLRIRVEGRGSVNAIPEPDATAIGPFEVFESKKEDLVSGAAADGLRGGRVFEMALRAKQSGTLTIAPIHYSAFNPWTQKYESVATSPLTIVVDPPADVPEVFSASPAGAPGEATRHLADGMEYIETDGFQARRTRSRAYEDPLIWALQSIPLLMLAGALGLRKRRQYLEQNSDGVRRRWAKSVADKRLKKAAALCKEGFSDAFYAELSRALRGFIGDKLNRPSAGLRFDEVHSTLLQRNIDGDLANQMAQLLEQSDSARYAPASSGVDRMRETLANARAIIEKLNKELH